MDFLRTIYTTRGRLNRLSHLRYQMFWRLIAVTVEYILYFISDASISAPEGIFIAMFPSAWSLIAGVLTLIIFVIMKFITSPMIITDISPEILSKFVPDNWVIVICTWVIVAAVGNFMLMARRLHDLDKSGYFVLISLIPGISLIFSIYLFCAAGQVGSNQYGEDLLEN